ncbi:DUF2510 domain-containing protein [Gordonia sp. HY366]|uniref:DUF2510 domain-containing protein n=2 Tax=Gordonia liuliyuniae TaxID=2911517 RepID=A0ABS9INK5_9ACTN|nr:DUF2510 domain-containing protein [Gordonia liuliyuniae]
MPAGWYQDPDAPHLLRYWDNGWTEHTAPHPRSRDTRSSERVNIVTAATARVTDERLTAAPEMLSKAIGQS